MSPSSFRVRLGRGQTCIPTLSVAPAAISMNTVIDHLIDNLVGDSIAGVKCVNAFEEQVELFFDIIGFIEYYPASIMVVNLKGYIAAAPCTYCGLTICKTLGQSVFVYITSVHSCTTSYRRNQDRGMSIVEPSLSKAGLNGWV